jgi:tellurite resistance protein
LVAPNVEAIVKGLVAVAWADGRIQKEEREVITRIAAAFRLSKDEVASIEEYAQTPRTLDDLTLDGLSQDDRRMLLQHALIVTYIDGELLDVEIELLDDLAARLQIDANEAQRILDLARKRAKHLQPVG